MPRTLRRLRAMARWYAMKRNQRIRARLLAALEPVDRGHALRAALRWDMDRHPVERGELS